MYKVFNYDSSNTPNLFSEVVSIEDAEDLVQVIANGGEVGEVWFNDEFVARIIPSFVYGYSAGSNA